MKKHPKTLAATTLLTLSALALVGCSAAQTETTSATSTATGLTCTESTGAATTAATILAANGTTHATAEDYEWAESDVQELKLDGSSVTISSVGTYHVTGQISDGQILIDTSGTGIVRLILDGVNIANSAGAAIEVANAPEVMLVLAEGSTNKVSDASSYAEDAEVNAAIFSKNNLTITGDGALEVIGNGNDAINSKDGLVVSGGEITVTSADDAIRGKDYVVIEGGNLTIDASGDAIKSDNDTTNTLGFIAISGGTINATSKTDGMQAATDIVVTGGTQNFAAADDGLNSGCVTELAGGSVTVAAADDGVHSDGELFIADGVVVVTESYEALEAAAAYISGGNINVSSSDDGVNIYESETGSLATQVTISGGNLVINAQGDGLDSNAVGTITGGNIVVNGPTEGGNGSMDGDFTISGGTLLAIGSDGMAIAPSTESEQLSIKVTLTTEIAAGETITIKDAAGTTVHSFTTAKTIQNVVFSSNALSAGTTYNIFSGSSQIGTGVAGEYENNEFGGGGAMGGPGGDRPKRPE